MHCAYWPLCLWHVVTTIVLLRVPNGQVGKLTIETLSQTCPQNTLIEHFVILPIRAVAISNSTSLTPPNSHFKQYQPHSYHASRLQQLVTRRNDKVNCSYGCLYVRLWTCNLCDIISSITCFALPPTHVSDPTPHAPLSMLWHTLLLTIVYYDILTAATMATPAGKCCRT